MLVILGEVPALGTFTISEQLSIEIFKSMIAYEKEVSGSSAQLLPELISAQFPKYADPSFQKVKLEGPNQLAKYAATEMK